VADLLTESDGEIFKVAAGALSVLNHPVAVRALGDALRVTAPERVSTLFEAAVKVTDPSVVALMMDLLRSEDAHIRGQAARATALLIAPEQSYQSVAKAIRDAVHSSKVVETLLEMAHDSERSVRRSAVDALGRMRAKNATSLFLGLLKDEDEELRRFAVQGIGRVDDRSAVLQLIDALGDPAVPVRTAAAQALHEIGADLDAVTPAMKMIAEIGDGPGGDQLKAALVPIIAAARSEEGAAVLRRELISSGYYARNAINAALVEWTAATAHRSP
jgi:HEAT repeat protein